MAEYVTLDVHADAGGVKTPVSRATNTEYADGYVQKVFNGRQRMYDKLTFTYSGDYDETTAVYSLLHDSIYNNQPFYFRFNGTETARLYTVADETLNHTHIGGLKWSVAATFEEWNGVR